jgi:hypothetical protein
VCPVLISGKNGLAESSLLKLKHFITEKSVMSVPWKALNFVCQSRYLN